jgi:hypothetical protein
MASLREQSPSVFDSSAAVFTVMVEPEAVVTRAEAGLLCHASNATSAAMQAANPIVVAMSAPVLDIHLLLSRWVEPRYKRL